MFVPQIPSSSSYTPHAAASTPHTPETAVVDAVQAFGLEQIPLPATASFHEFANLTLDKYLRMSRINGYNPLEGTFFHQILSIITPVLQWISKEEPANNNLKELITVFREMTEWALLPYMHRTTEILKKLKTQNIVTIPFSWCAVEGDHALIFRFIKRSNHYVWEIYNTGAGYHYHNHFRVDVKGSDKMCPCYIIDAIPASKLESKEFFEMLFEKSMLTDDEQITAEERSHELYSIMASLCEGTLLSPQDYLDIYKRDFEAVDQQESGTCVSQVIYAFLLLNLQDRRLYSRIKHRIGLHLFYRLPEILRNTRDVTLAQIKAAHFIKLKEATRYYETDGFLSAQEYAWTVALYQSFEREFPTAIPSRERVGFRFTPPASSVVNLTNPFESDLPSPCSQDTGRILPELSFDITDIKNVLSSFLYHIQSMENPFQNVFNDAESRKYSEIWEIVYKIRSNMMPYSGSTEHLYKILFSFLPKLDESPDFWNHIPIDDIPNVVVLLKRLIRYTPLTGNISGMIYTEYLYAIMVHLVKRELVALFPGLQQPFTTLNFGERAFALMANEFEDYGLFLTCPILTHQVKYLRSPNPYQRHIQESNIFYCRGNALVVREHELSESALFKFLKVISNVYCFPLSASNILSIFSQKQCNGIPDSFWILWEAYQLRVDPCLSPMQYPILSHAPNFLFLINEAPMKDQELVLGALKERISWQNHERSFPSPFDRLYTHQFPHDSYNTYLFEGLGAGEDLSKTMIAREFTQIVHLGESRLMAGINFIRRYRHEPIFDDDWNLIKGLLWYVRKDSKQVFDPSWIQTKNEFDTYYESLEFLYRFLTELFILKFDPSSKDPSKLEMLESITTHLLVCPLSHTLLFEKAICITKLIIPSIHTKGIPYLYILERWFRSIHQVIPSQEGQALLYILQMIRKIPIAPNEPKLKNPTSAILDLAIELLAPNSRVDGTLSWKKIAPKTYRKGKVQICVSPLLIKIRDNPLFLTTMRDINEIPLLKEIFGEFRFTSVAAFGTVISDCRNISVHPSGTVKLQGKFVRKTIERLYPKARSIIAKCEKIPFWRIVNAGDKPYAFIEQWIKSPINLCLSVEAQNIRMLLVFTETHAICFQQNGSVVKATLLLDDSDIYSKEHIYKLISERYFQKFSIELEPGICLSVPNSKGIIKIYHTTYNLTFKSEITPQGEYRLKSLNFPGYYMIPTPFKGTFAIQHVYLSAPLYKASDAVRNNLNRSPEDEELWAGDKLLILSCLKSKRVAMLPLDEDGLPIGNTIEENMTLLLGIAIPCGLYEYGRKLIWRCKKGREITKKEIHLLSTFLLGDDLLTMNDLPEVVALRAELDVVIKQYETSHPPLNINARIYTQLKKDYRHIPLVMRPSSRVWNIYQQTIFNLNTIHRHQCGAYPVETKCSHDIIDTYITVNALQYDFTTISGTIHTYIHQRKLQYKTPLLFEELLNFEIENVYDIIEFAVLRPWDTVKFDIRVYALKFIEALNKDVFIEQRLCRSWNILLLMMYLCMDDELFSEIKAAYDASLNLFDVIEKQFFSRIVSAINIYIITRVSKLKSFNRLSSSEQIKRIQDRTIKHTPEVLPRNTLLCEFGAQISPRLKTIPAIGPCAPLPELNIFEGLVDAYFEKQSSPKYFSNDLAILRKSSLLPPASRELLSRLVTHCNQHQAEDVKWRWRHSSSRAKLQEYLKAISATYKKRIDTETASLRFLLNPHILADYYESKEALNRALIESGTASVKTLPISIDDILKWVILSDSAVIPNEIKQRARGLLILKMCYLCAELGLELLSSDASELVELMQSCERLKITGKDSYFFLLYQIGRGVVLRDDQMKLLHNQMQGSIALQAASGMGKSDIIIPLLLTWNHGKVKDKRRIIIVPDALHETMHQRLNELVPKTGFLRVDDFFFQRKFPKGVRQTNVLNELFNPKVNPNTLMPVIGKQSSFQSLLLHYFESLLKLRDPNNSYNRNGFNSKSMIVENVLSHIHYHTELIYDEVHIGMNPHKWVNYDYGEVASVDPARWKIGLDALKILAQIGFNFHLSEATFNIGYYYTHFLGPLIDDIISKSSTLFIGSFDLVELRYILRFNKSKPTVDDVERSNAFLNPLYEEDQIMILRLRSYLHVYLPQCLQSKYLSAYGPSPHSKYAVHYNGNNTPTNAQFASADVKLLLTALMTIKEGLSPQQMQELIQILKSILTLQKSSSEPPHPAYSRFSTPVESIDEASPTVLHQFHRELKYDVDVILAYLELSLFPKATEATQRLTANAQDITVALLPKNICLGATLNNNLFYPVVMKTVFDAKTDSEIVADLLNPAICQVATTPRENWISAILAEDIIAVADPCDILIGKSNEEIARIILENRADLQGVVVFHSITKEPCICYRDGTVGLYNKSIHKNLNLLVYFDGPHCTGSDFRLPLRGRMVIFVDKDLPWTLYVQTCKRLRKLGENKQTFVAHLTVECADRIRHQTELSPQELQGNSPLQLMQMTMINEGETQEIGLYPALMNSITAFLRREMLRKFFEISQNTSHYSVLSEKIEMIDRYIDLLSETTPPDAHYAPGKITLPISLADKIEMKVYEYMEKYPELTLMVSKELQQICERARAILSFQYDDASTASIYSGVEIESQTQTHNQEFECLSHNEKNITTSRAVGIADIEDCDDGRGDFSERIQFDDSIYIWKLKNALDHFHIPFDDDLYITDNALNSFKPTGNNIWGVHNYQDPPMQTERKVDAALSTTKAIPAFLEWNVEGSHTLWILLSTQDVDNFYGNNKSQNSRYFRNYNYILRDNTGRVLTECGESSHNSNNDAKVQRILAQLAIYNTDDFIHKALQPYLFQWLTEVDPKSVERFYVRLRDRRFRSSPVVYRSTAIYEVFTQALRRP